MSTLFIGNNTIKLPIVDSTNTTAQNLIKENQAPEGTIVIADAQRMGRGQRGNSWISESGKNLTFSVVLYPRDVTPEHQFILNQMASLAIRDFIVSQLPSAAEVKVKWPNDIYVGSKKIAGILIENTWRGNSLYSCIIGIGLNINQDEFENERACSIKQLIEKSLDLDTCLNSLNGFLEKRYLQIVNKQWTSIRNDYHKDLYLLQREANFEFNGKTVRGKIIGVNVDGRLQIALTEHFQVLELGFKEIKFLH